MLPRNTVLAVLVLFACDACWLAQLAWCATMPAAPAWSYLFDGNAVAAEGGVDGMEVGDQASFYDTEVPFLYSGNQSLLLDGTTDYIDIPGLSTALNGLSEMTISMWIKSDVIGSDRPFLGLVEAGNGDDGGIRYDNAGFTDTSKDDIIKVSFFTDGGNNNYETSTNFIQKTDWQHVAVVWKDGDGVTIYIDNVAETPPGIPPGDDFDTTGIISDQTRFTVGQGPKGQNGDTWDGRIDELAVWNSALSADEIDWLFTNSINPVVMTVPGDVDGDGVADMMDFAIIRDNFRTGTTLEEGNLDRRGTTDMADFRIWKNAFLNPPAAVPEPSAVTMAAAGLLTGGFMAIGVRRRRVD